ncbi:uncharacterized protein LOC128931746 isoform X1 [Callithrix jacchus]|uniref:uncharacterized protein LOC128931746 n=1 Tax=Callithrix jacchus TaxID=9483 RepID=UPI0023DCF9D9|nr:uncharacterized protein LOC128931746 [Callithrix jacchus]
MPVSVPAPTEAHTARPERRQRRRRRRRPAPASLAQPQGSQWQRWQPQPGRREVGVVGGGPCWIRPEGSPHRRRQRRGQSEFLWRSRGSFNMTVEDETGLCAAPILGFSGFASPAAPCHKKEELSAACWRLEPVAPQLASLQWVTAMETAERWRGRSMAGCHQGRDGCRGGQVAASEVALVPGSPPCCLWQAELGLPLLLMYRVQVAATVEL